MHPSTFGARSRATHPTFTFVQHRERMRSLLHNDDLNAWVREYGSNDNMLGPWVRENIVHVLQSCPAVLARWRATMPTHLADKMVMHCLSQGLDGIGDGDKLLALEGKSSKRFERMLGNFLQDDEKNWAWLSPAWVGAPGTPLRAYANSHGWLPGQLLGQVAKSLDQERTPSWAAWVAYPQCLRVIQRQIQVRLQQRQNMDIQTLKKTSPIWADPIDVVLAQQLIAQSPEPLFLDLTAHKDLTPLSEDEHARLQGLVEVHIAVGGIKPLHASLLAGVVPGVEMASSMVVELPDLGDLPCG